MDEHPSTIGSTVMDHPATSPAGDGGIDLGALYGRFGPMLGALASRALPPVIAARLDEADVVQEAFAAAAKRRDYLATHPEVPVYFKLRTILFQTIADLERRHLGSARRDAFREVSGDAPAAPGNTTDSLDPAAPLWDALPSDRTSPRSALAREERHVLLRDALHDLSEADRQILVLRHFDGLGNSECADVLGLSPTAANARYTRALERLRARLLELSEFRP